MQPDPTYDRLAIEWRGHFERRSVTRRKWQAELVRGSCVRRGGESVSAPGGENGSKELLLIRDRRADYREHASANSPQPPDSHLLVQHITRHAFRTRLVRGDQAHLTGLDRGNRIELGASVHGVLPVRMIREDCVDGFRAIARNRGKRLVWG